jgi:hypothetical protein
VPYTQERRREQKMRKTTGKGGSNTVGVYTLSSLPLHADKLTILSGLGATARLAGGWSKRLAHEGKCALQ